jgi:hypothetical protein
MKPQIEPFALTLSAHECAGLVRDLYRAAAAAFTVAAREVAGNETIHYESLVDAWEGEILALLARTVTEAMYAESGSAPVRARFVTLPDEERIIARIDGDTAVITVPDSHWHSTGANLQPYIATHFQTSH